MDLSCAENDCITLHGFLRFAARYDTVHLLRAPSSGQVLDAAADITQHLDDGDLFLFYFAGHGVEHDGRHLLLCPKVRYFRLSYMQELVPVDLLRQETDRRGLSRAFILDACRSSLLRTRGSEGVGPGGGRALRDVVADAPVPAGGALAILCSCGEGERAGEIAGKGQGLFSAALLETLRAALDRGLAVTLSDDLETALSLRMAALAREHGLRPGQRPWIQRSGPPPVLIPGAEEAGPAERRGATRYAGGRAIGGGVKHLSDSGCAPSRPDTASGGAIQGVCPGCGRTYSVDSCYAGLTGKCRTCGAAVTVPSPAGTTNPDT